MPAASFASTSSRPDIYVIALHEQTAWSAEANKAKLKTSCSPSLILKRVCLNPLWPTLHVELLTSIYFVSVDLTPLFNYNTKQLMLQVVAEFHTEKYVCQASLGAFLSFV